MRIKQKSHRIPTCGMLKIKCSVCEDGTGVTLVCPNGDYSTLYTGGTLVSCPYDGEALVLAGAGGVQAKPYQTGGGSAGTGGVGRRPSGYADDKGTPSISRAGLPKQSL